MYSPCDSSLMSLKIVLGIILLKLARSYHPKNTEKAEEDQPDSSVVTFSKSLVDVSDGRYPLRQRKSLSCDSNIAAVMKIDHSVSAPQKSITKSKSLSDIERFTLCSNRIV